MIVSPALRQHAINAPNGRLRAAYVPPHAGLAFVGELRVSAFAPPIAATLTVDELTGRVDSVQLYHEVAARRLPVPIWVRETVADPSRAVVDAYLAGGDGQALIRRQLGIALAEVDEVMAHGWTEHYLWEQRATLLRLLIRHNVTETVVLAAADRIAERWQGSLHELIDEARKTY